MTYFDQAETAIALLASRLAADEEMIGRLIAQTPDLAGSVLNLSSRLVALERKIADLLSPSGQAMPTDVPAGWKVAIAEDFDTPCAEGQFEAVYVPRGIGFYKDGWVDTSHHGTYSSKLISAKGSVCSIRLVGPQPPSVQATVASIYPKSSTGPITAVIFEERLRYTLTPGFKVAHLMWPDSGDKLPDGEMDWPEGTGVKPPSGFVHKRGATDPSQQVQFKTTIDPTKWHTYRREWEAGLYVRYYCDGVLIGALTGDAVPNVPFHFSLQNETALGGVVTIASDHGLVETDWMRSLVKA